MTIFIRILDVLTFLVLLLSLQFSYGRRFNRAQNAFSVLLLCLFGLVEFHKVLQILFRQKNSIF